MQYGRALRFSGSFYVASCGQFRGAISASLRLGAYLLGSLSGKDAYCSNAVIRWPSPTPVVLAAPGEWALVDDERDEMIANRICVGKKGSLHT